MKYIKMLPTKAFTTYRGKPMKDGSKPKVPNPEGNDDLEDLIVSNQDFYFGRLEQQVWGKPKNAIRLHFVVDAIKASEETGYLVLEDSDYEIMKQSIEVDMNPVFAWNSTEFIETFKKADEVTKKPADFVEPEGGEDDGPKDDTSSEDEDPTDESEEPRPAKPAKGSKKAK